MTPSPSPGLADPWLADFPGRLTERAADVSAAVARYLDDGDQEALAAALEALEAVVVTAQVARHRLAEHRRSGEENGLAARVRSHAAEVRGGRR